jgi:hypothetical protein
MSGLQTKTRPTRANIRFTVVVSIQEADVRGYAIGDRVSQLQYGNGTIRLVDEYHTVIDFDEHGLRRFATAMVKLERSTTLEPDKPPKRTRKKAAPKQERDSQPR